MKPRMHHHQTYQNYEQPPRTSQNSDFQSHFLVLKIDQIFPFFFFEEYWTRHWRSRLYRDLHGLGDKLLIKNIFENLIFKSS